MNVETKTTRSGFLSWIYYVDQILRGNLTRDDRIAQSGIKFPVIGVSVVVILLGVIYGLCMGVFALISGAESSQYSKAFAQTFASMCKVPLLFGLTLVITLPSLYVFNALIGSKLPFISVFKLLIASLAVNLAVLASMGPILAFFSASTPNYSFIVLLNVALFSMSGFLGLSFLLQTLNRLAAAAETHPINVPQNIETDSPSTSLGESAEQQSDPETHVVDEDDVRIVSANLAAQPHRPLGPLDQPPNTQIEKPVKGVFVCWLIVFGLVGAQSGWILRPFIGAPNKEFQWFRARESNFFEAVLQSFWNLF